MVRSFYYSWIKRAILLALGIMFCSPFVFGQSDLKGILLNRADSTAVLYATIHLNETDQSTITNENGEFVLSVPDEIKQCTFSITSIGCKTIISYKRTFNDPEKVYIDMIAGSLSEVTVSSITAKEVVEKAIEAIRENYTDSDHYTFAMYHQYQKINNVFRNLVEAQHVVKFDLSRSKHKILADEQFVITDLRRTVHVASPDDLNENNLVNLLTEDPIYYQSTGSLEQKRSSAYTFSFDTAETPGNYVVNYTCKDHSTESHGVLNYNSFDFYGESWETGRLVIDKRSFAIKKVQRSSFRYPRYHYPKNNNIVQPERRYTVEFLKGEMVADYVQYNGKWYLKQLVHQYTNGFYRTIDGHKDHEITDCFEWYAEAISRTIPKELKNSFSKEIAHERYEYDSARWSDIKIPFYFYNKDIVSKDLERNGDLEAQYEREGN